MHAKRRVIQVVFTAMTYNILAENYVNPKRYRYCPSWALKWDVRVEYILDELTMHCPDVIALQVGRSNLCASLFSSVTEFSA